VAREVAGSMAGGRGKVKGSGGAGRGQKWAQENTVPCVLPWAQKVSGRGNRATGRARLYQGWGWC